MFFFICFSVFGIMSRDPKEEEGPQEAEGKDDLRTATNGAIPTSLGQVTYR